jgi:hypothetical protein
MQPTNFDPWTSPSNIQHHLIGNLTTKALNFSSTNKVIINLIHNAKFFNFQNLTTELKIKN